MVTVMFEATRCQHYKQSYYMDDDDNSQRVEADLWHANVAILQ